MVDDIVSFSFKKGVRFDIDNDVEVTRQAAIKAGVSFAGDP